MRSPEADIDRPRHIDERALLSTHLSEISFRGKEHRRIQYAVLTAFAVHGVLEPDLLDEVTYWIEQYWQYALFAAVAIVAPARNTRACRPRPSPLTWPAHHSLDIA